MACTTFRLYFPISGVIEAPAADLDEAAGPGAVVPQTNVCETILLVEDEQNMLYVLHQMLSRRSYRVVSATDGQAARDVLRTGARQDRHGPGGAPARVILGLRSALCCYWRAPSLV